ncbi:hypothetical protein V4F39_06120 [Aquincola sp. MAHUQ-54]|uniref:Uncharacterized protein n=1 Tax=Aquincola agrisoli TaxID=3119538 RepID=A0AAW9QDI0_9BURK
MTPHAPLGHALRDLAFLLSAVAIGIAIASAASLVAGEPSRTTVASQTTTVGSCRAGPGAVAH